MEIKLYVGYMYYLNWKISDQDRHVVDWRLGVLALQQLATLSNPTQHFLQNWSTFSYLVMSNMLCSGMKVFQVSSNHWIEKLEFNVLPEEQ